MTHFCLACWWIGLASARASCFDCYEEKLCPLLNRHLQIYDTKCVEDCMARCHLKMGSRLHSKDKLQQV